MLNTWKDMSMVVYAEKRKKRGKAPVDAKLATLIFGQGKKKLSLWYKGVTASEDQLQIVFEARVVQACAATIALTATLSSRSTFP
jgi:hypothetical protein